jgi:hypothetical protein
MDRFLNRPNIERYRKLRQTQSAAERRQILNQLAGETAKFKLELRNIDLSREPSRIECQPG